jgi:hypothetical protein
MSSIPVAGSSMILKHTLREQKTKSIRAAALLTNKLDRNLSPIVYFQSMVKKISIRVYSGFSHPEHCNENSQVLIKLNNK